MSDLISRKEAMSHPFANGQYDHKNANKHFIMGFESYKEWLSDLPSAEKTGHWILVENPNYSPFDGSSENVMLCSVCGYKHCGYKQEQHYFNYCPNCGAKVKGDQGGKSDDII